MREPTDETSSSEKLRDNEKLPPDGSACKDFDQESKEVEKGNNAGSNDVSWSRSNAEESSSKDSETTCSKESKIKSNRTPKERVDSKATTTTASAVMTAATGGKTHRSKERRKIGALKSSLEKKVGTVERMLEDRVERILEENVEKHPWLQPIESWITDRYKFSQGDHANQSTQQTRRYDKNVKRTSEVKRPDIVLNSATCDCLEECNERTRFEFKYIVADRNNDESRVESTRVVENRKRLSRPESPKYEKNGRDVVGTGAVRVKQVDSFARADNADDHLGARIATGDQEGILKLKDTRQQNNLIFDKLKDNVKGKMEDLHRVSVLSIYLLYVNRSI